jgi:hypothetical protein
VHTPATFGAVAFSVTYTVLDTTAFSEFSRVRFIRRKYILGKYFHPPQLKLADFVFPMFQLCQKVSLPKRGKNLCGHDSSKFLTL